MTDDKHCVVCKGTGKDGGKLHIDAMGNSEWESYRCEACGGFGWVKGDAVSVQRSPDESLEREMFEQWWLASEYSLGMGAASLVRVWADDPASDYAINRTRYLFGIWKDAFAAGAHSQLADNERNCDTQ